MTSLDDSLASFFADLTRRFIGVESVDDVLTLIVHATFEIMPTCDHVSVSYLRGRTLVSRSSNDDVGPLLDAIQTEAQEGPCFDAIRHRTAFSTGDLGADPRWPVYGPRAVEATDVRSSLATPLDSGSGVIGALNLFSEQLVGFKDDPGVHATIAILAAHATAALHATLHREQMATALRSRDLIGQAKGILMAHGNVDEAAAFGQLAAASQRMNLKVSEIAQRLIDGSLTDERGDGPPNE